VNPFAQNNQKSIGSIGESELIARMKTWLGKASPSAPRGIGDDSALIPLPAEKSELLVTTDPIVYGRHFDDTLSPEFSADKLIRRNLSDIAAMGGAPFACVLALSAPAKLSLEWLERFYRQLAKEAEHFGVEISGGDICATNAHLGIDLTLLGSPSRRTLQRKHAQPGDQIYVTGSLGGTRLRKHYAFEPRLREGQYLASNAKATSCMDISDGLGKDLPSLLSDDTIAIISGNHIPISPDAVEYSKRSGRNELYHALNDGEDFELLFTAKGTASDDTFISDWNKEFETPVTKIGYIKKRTNDSEASVIFEKDSPNTELSGYEHFSQT